MYFYYRGVAILLASKKSFVLAKERFDMSSTKKDDRPDNGVHNVVVKSINDNATTTYELDSKYDTMRTLMIKIYNKKGIPTVKQKLFYKGIRCDQMAGSIAALDIKPNSEMELIVEESSGAAFAGIQGQVWPLAHFLSVWFTSKTPNKKGPLSDSFSPSPSSWSRPVMVFWGKGGVTDLCLYVGSRSTFSHL